jgi:heat shock protein HslJ
MRFSLAGGDSIVTPLVAPVRLQDVAAVSFRVQTAKGLLTVIVYNRPCANSMSGPKKVEATWNNKKYEGCATYPSDYRLDDICILRSINNTAIDARKLMKGSPRCAPAAT